MSREDLHFRLRIPEDLKQRIAVAASENHRSMTAEIIARLEASFAMGATSDRPRASHWEMPEGVTLDDVSRAYEEATRQAISMALKRLGVVERPIVVADKSPDEADT
ncbi:Arc family DNA-binding protein [Mesorhizobium sp. ANAO-SY3R2]|uniref:Arc family DNA-binding protein n=1 Tax=Mesorhizobium sp. ANAO-SY3R2 TaxID=3166644 RepID=UPI00366F3E25